MTDILKTKVKLIIVRENIVDEYVTHTISTTNMKSAQQLLRQIIFNNV